MVVNNMYNYTDAIKNLPKTNKHFSFTGRKVVVPLCGKILILQFIMISKKSQHAYN